MSRFSDGALRPATLSIAGLALATAVVVAIAALPGRASAQPEPSTPPASGAPAGEPSNPPPSPSATPVATPAPVATPVATPVPSAAPAGPSTAPEDGGSDAIPLAVDLETFDGHPVSMDVVDRTGAVSGAASGHPGDGASVEADSVAVSNVDGRTLRLTWIDYPIANRDALFVDEVGGHLRLLLIQPEHDGPTDAIGFDRELILTFDRPVDASTVETMIQGGLDTGG